MPVTEPILPPEELTPTEVIERARICAAATRERAVEAEKMPAGGNYSRVNRLGADSPAHAQALGRL
jgi:hypothetical protein